ncbi:MAG: sulfatase [Acidobacteriota bacterium]
MSLETGAGRAKGSRRRSRILLACLVALLPLASACERPAGESLVERFIEEDPEILLDRGALFSAETAFTWTFDSEEALADFETSRREASTQRDDGHLLRSAEGSLQLTRALPAPGAEAGDPDPEDSLHELRVTLAGLKGKATLSWTDGARRFSEERSITLDPPPAAGPEAPVVLTFDLAAHRQWRGSAERLRLRLRGSGEAPAAVWLSKITGVRRIAKPAQLAEALARPFKVDLDSEARNVRLAPPGVPIEKGIEVGAGERLRLSYGVQGNVQESIEFRVRVREKSAAGAGAESGPADTQEEGGEVLWSATLDPSRDANRWFEQTLDLAPWSGRAVTIRLETASQRTPDLARGFPLWANPEIVGPPPPEGETRPNVILVSLDTLRADRLSGYGNPQPTSPHLDAWAEKSAVLFENTVVQAPWTLPSHASMFTGLEALRHDVNHFGTSPASLEMLAEILRREGYRTAAITGGGYLRPRFGFAQGFDTFRYWPSILAEEELAEGKKRLFDWLDEQRARPFFLLFHTYEVHFPHRERQPYFSRFDSGERGNVRGAISLRARPQKPLDPLWQHDYFVVTTPEGEEIEHLNEDEKAHMFTMYDSAIGYVDEVMGQLFERLERLGLKGRTLIVVTSDHGEAMGEANRGGHNYHGDYNVMVPLIIEFPDGFGAGTRVPQQVRSIDIVPTILDSLGLRARAMDGVSLRPLIAGQSDAVPEEAWTYASSANYGIGLRYRNQLKYVFNNTAWQGTLGREELYDLQSDPGETVNLSESHPATERLRAKVRQTLEEQHEGLRLRLRNGSDGVLSGLLGHEFTHRDRVKAIDPDCRCLSWNKHRTARFRLQPGQETTLFFEALPGPIVGFQGQLELPGREPAPFDKVFNLQRTGDAPFGLLFEDGAWSVKPAPLEAGDGVVGFTVWREAPLAELRSEGPEDPELLEQLKALGYVNP